MFVSGIASRPFGTVPHIPGVCLPYIFIGDDETPGRSISATYRLKDHPDITIWLEDSNAARIGPGQNPEKFTPVSQSDFFWTQRYGSGVRKSVRSIWAIPYRNIDFAGQKGVESFVRIIRGDDAEDFGYLAVVRGDPDAKKDTPDLMLYVIRDAKNSTAKGIEPVSKDAFLEIAQTIAASVKRRPTK
ncbi:MAG: hypothetical protein JWL63_3314 [Rhodocyclales bacterium]|nr:hypothetical protein [Rhodocyclales bacterium]